MYSIKAKPVEEKKTLVVHVVFNKFVNNKVKRLKSKSKIYHLKFYDIQTIYFREIIQF